MHSPVCALLFALLGALYIAISLPLIRGRVKPNHWYGFRTPRTLSDPEVWYAANRVAGRDLALAGASMVAFALGTLVVSPWVSPPVVTAANLAVMLAALAAAVAHSFLELYRM